MPKRQEMQQKSFALLILYDPRLTIFRVLKSEAITFLILAKNPVRLGS